MADYSDFRDKNTKFTGTVGERVSSGTTGERDTSTYGAGTLRFNTTTNLMEYYSGTDWKAIDAPPVITSFSIDGGSNVTSGVVDNEGGGTVTIAVNGSLFDTTGANVTLIGSGETLTPDSLTRNNANLLTAVFTESAFDIGNSPYTLKVTNGSGLSAELADAISADQTLPVFTNAADTTIIQFDSQRGTAISAANLCGASGTVGANPYSITAGALPTGLTLNTATAEITGTADAEASDTTYTFTVSATGDDATATRQFKITIKAPVIQTYTSTGGFNYTIPSGATSGNVLLVAGGGGSAWIGGGGGGGGVVEHPGYDFTPHTPGTVPGSLGGGGTSSPGSDHTNQGQWNGRGGDTTFGTLTAKGGGSTSGWIYQTDNAEYNYSPGGSGGGGTGNMDGGQGTQPTQPGDSGSSGHGFPGAAAGNHPNSPNTWNSTTKSSTHSGGGGGGAGSAGGHPSVNGPGDTRNLQPAGRFGGYGYQSNYSGTAVTYGGGGAGSSHSGTDSAGVTIPAAPGGGGSANPNSAGQNGTTNRGGGAGGGWYPDYNGGVGGPGFVAVRV
jgi:hypothetical protein